MHVESMSSSSNLHKNQGSDVALLSSACHPVFNFSRADKHVEDDLLGKSTIQRQKFAMHINTRHMAPYHVSVEASVPYQSGLTSMQDATKLMAEDIEMGDAGSIAMNAPKQSASEKREKGTHTRKKALHSILLSKPKSCSLASTSMTPGPFSCYKVPVTQTTTIQIASTSHHGQVKPTHPSEGIRSRRQIHFMRKVQGWSDALQCIYKSRQDSELFGDEPTGTPNLLKLLEEIDKQKYDVTHEVAEAASLVQEINWVQRYLDESTDEECIRLAERILRDFRQRFHGENN